MAREQRDEAAQESDGDTVRLSRRSYLKMAGLSVAAVAAVTDGSNSKSTTVPQTTEMAIYGYGGAQVFEQQGSITTSAFSGAVQDLTPVSESESNDRQATADEVSLGSTVSAELTADEVDWYAFDATKDQSVVLELDRESGDGVTALILYDSNGDYINLRYVGTGEPTRIDLDSAPATDTYFAQVVDIQSGDGPYTLTVQDEQNVTPTPTETPTPTPTPTETPTPTPSPTPTPEQRPYYGTLRDGTKRIEAEEYDEGGEGVAYHDLEAENRGGEFRSEGVDIQKTSDDDGYNVGWVDDGEWLEYTITLPAGKYDFEARVAAWETGQQLRVLLNGNELGHVEVPETGGSQNWETATLSGVSVDTDGEQVLRLEAVGGHFNINWVRFAESVLELQPGQTPYGGTARSIPGRIEAEDFDEGGEGVAYSDNEPENKGGEYRNEGPDVELSGDVDGGYNVGHIWGGEWLEYTVRVTPGTYDIRLRVASANSGRQLELSLGDETLGTVDVPNTGGWYEWQTITLSGVEIAAEGPQMLRVDAIGDGQNLNWIEFEATTETPTETPTATPTPTPTPTPTFALGTQGYGEYGYGGTQD